MYNYHNYYFVISGIRNASLRKVFRIGLIMGHAVNLTVAAFGVLVIRMSIRILEGL